MPRNPDLESLSWYHACLPRNKAERLLLEKCAEGCFLLRLSTDLEQYVISARSVHTCCHFTVTYDKGVISYGLKVFNSIAEFTQHFKSGPVVTTNEGDTVRLTRPYALKSGNYDFIVEHGEDHNTPGSPPDVQTTNMSGYLTKRGGRVKTWKKRWFVGSKSTLKYFEEKSDMEAIRAIDLAECSVCSPDNTQPGRDFCFRLVLSWRTFYIDASSDDERRKWIMFIKSKQSDSKQGYLTKMGGKHKNWRKRWCTVSAHKLKYFKTNESGSKPQKTLVLHEASECCPDDSMGKQHCFRVTFQWRTFYFYADSHSDMESWIKDISSNMKRKDAVENSGQPSESYPSQPSGGYHREISGGYHREISGGNHGETLGGYRREPSGGNNGEPSGGYHGATSGGYHGEPSGGYHREHSGGHHGEPYGRYPDEACVVTRVDKQMTEKHVRLARW